MKRNILLAIAMALILVIATIPTYANVNTDDWNEVYTENYSSPSAVTVSDEFDLLDGASADLSQIVRLHLLTEYDTFTEEGILDFEDAITSGSSIIDMIEGTNDFFAKTSAGDTVILSLKENGTLFVPQVTMIGDDGNAFEITSDLQTQLNSSELSMILGAEAKCVGIPGVGTAIVFTDGDDEFISFTVSRFSEIIEEDTLYTVGDVATIMEENKEIIADIGGETEDTYTVTYDSNGATGGSAPTDSSDYASGNSVTVKANTGNLVRTNYEFLGWSESSTATTPTYAVNGTTATPANFNMGTSNVTLYAVWGTSSSGVLPTSITLDCEYIAIRPYDNTTLTATVSPNNATNQTVTWYSSNDEWVTVDEYGYVESIEDIVYLTDEPYVTITAETVNGLTATCTVEIQHIRR